MAGDAEQTRREPAPAGPAVDVDLAHLRARSRALLDLSPAEPVKVGRFTIVERIGQGGMGVVYLAYDPELDRRVALKMLRPEATWDDDEIARGRMLREAQAMAKLSHPNVLPVYDVGEVADRIYLAVEYVEGVTLGDWMKQPHDWREVLAVLEQAGRGLEAAHRVGLVHRDFKPGNVLVGDDGRVRVLDFGLARAADDTASAGASLTTQSGRSSGSSLDAVLTRVGAVVGTPAYMSPEQRAGKEAGAASDQYSFCVVLYEALYGRRPYSDEDLRPGHIPTVDPPPPQPKVPPKIRRAMVRGLSTDADARFASMSALLAELGVGRRSSLPWLVGGFGVATVAAVLAFPSAAQCPDPSAKLAGIWDDARRAEIEAAFERSGASYADDAWRAVDRAMDERVQAWSGAYRESCEAADQGWESEELHLQRTLCLEWQLQEVQALSDLFAEVDGEMVERAAEAVDGLPSVRQCAAEHVDEDRVRPPSDPKLRQEIREVRIELAEVDALRRAGKYGRALDRARPSLERARGLGYAPLEAESTLAVGRAEAALGQLAEAETTIMHAIELAQASRHDGLVARAWIDLLDLIAVQQARLEEARRLSTLGRGAVARLADPDSLDAELLRIEGSIARLQGRFDDAIDLHERALEQMRAQVGSEHATIAQLEGELAMSLRDAGRVEAALEHAEAAYRVTRATRGDQHPDVATRLSVMASIIRGQGEDDRVLEWFERALEIRQAAHGPEHPSVAGDLHNLASALSRRGEQERAIPYYERALAIDEKMAGSDRARMAPTLYELGMLQATLGRHAQARANFERALAVVESALGPMHPNVTYPLIGLGTVAFQTGDVRAGRASFERALEVLESSVGVSHPRYVLTLSDYGGVALDGGDTENALDSLERAKKLLADTTLPPLDVAGLDFRLAQALVAAGRERTRAFALAGEAMASMQAGGVAERNMRDKIDAWLSEHAEKN